MSPIVDLTESQWKYWRNWAQQRTIRTLAFYQSNPLGKGKHPDGSFALAAFLKGWDAGQRSLVKAQAKETCQ